MSIPVVAFVSTDVESFRTKGKTFQFDRGTMLLIGSKNKVSNKNEPRLGLYLSRISSMIYLWSSTFPSLLQ